MTDASTTRPLRILYMYSPTNSAIGIVQAMVNVPHELPGIACRTPSGSRMTPSRRDAADYRLPDGGASLRALAIANDSPRVMALPLPYTMRVPAGSRA